MKEYIKETLLYYEKNYKKYESEKHDITMIGTYEPFLKRLPKDAKILDLGCGTGRDSLYFKKLGFQVVALDGSKEMCKIAEKNLNQKVICTTYENMDLNEQFDGIWACSSLLHLTEEDLINILKKLENYLQEDGILYASFKKGTNEEIENGRYFYYLTEEKWKKIEANLNYATEEMYYTKSVVKGHEDISWINLILRKKK